MEDGGVAPWGKPTDKGTGRPLLTAFESGFFVAPVECGVHVILLKTLWALGSCDKCRIWPM